MIRVKALKDFEQGGKIRFKEGEELNLKLFGGRYFLKIEKQKNKVIIPSEFIEEIGEAEEEEAEE